VGGELQLTDAIQLAIEEAVEALARLLLQGAKFNTVEKAGELTYPKFRERLAKVLGL